MNFLRERTPAYIYFLSMVFALPLTWMLVGRSGDDVPGMVSMIVMFICVLGISAGLSWLRRRILRRRDRGT